VSEFWMKIEREIEKEQNRQQRSESKKWTEILIAAKPNTYLHVLKTYKTGSNWTEILSGSV
jgi:hypothetical protein